MPTDQPAAHRAGKTARDENGHARHNGAHGGGRVNLDRAVPPQIAAKKALLRQAAARLLSRQTVGGIVLGETGMEAGWSYRTARYYYRNLDELLAETLVAHLVTLDAAICAAFDATADVPPAERLITLADAFLRTTLGQRNEHLALRLNTRLVSEARRPAVVGRSRQVIATLRQALFDCVPGLAAEPAIGSLLVRQLVGALSEATIWFREDDRVDRFGLAQLLTSQALVVAHAAVDGSWALPAPVTRPPVPVTPADPPPAVAESAQPSAIWLTPEQARRSLPRLVRAALAGTTVVLTHRGVPAAKLVPAAQERDRLHRIVGRHGE